MLQKVLRATFLIVVVSTCEKCHLLHSDRARISEAIRSALGRNESSSGGE